MNDDRINEMKTLFKTCVGSHVWNMNTPESDIDIFKCYIAPSFDFLMGKSHKSSHFSQVDNVDTTSTEVGVVVKQILKNNVNYLINVMSPIIVYDSKELQELRKLTFDSLSKTCYNSINGLAYGNCKRYILSHKKNTSKKRKTIARSLIFGINILDNKKIKFTSVDDDITVEQIEELMLDMQSAFESSSLPDKPENTKELCAWLLTVRMNELNEHLNFKEND